MVTSYACIKMQIGEHITATWVAYGNFFGTFYYHRIASIDGTGDMYDDINSSVCIDTGSPNDNLRQQIIAGTLSWDDVQQMCYEDTSLIKWNSISDNDVTWSSIQSSTTNLFSEAGISQGTILIPDGITTIAANFMSGFHVVGCNFPEGITDIGEYAFCRRIWHSDTCKCLIERLFLPSTLVHLGQKAFGLCNKLNSIVFNNDDYELDIYSTPKDITNGVFYVELNAGDNCDEDGNQKTYVFSRNKTIMSYDWKANFHRNIYGTEIARYCCFDEVNGYQYFRLYGEPVGSYNRAYYIESLGRIGYLPMVEVSDSDGGNRAQYVNGNVMRFKN